MFRCCHSIFPWFQLIFPWLLDFWGRIPWSDSHLQYAPMATRRLHRDRFLSAALPAAGPRQTASWVAGYVACCSHLLSLYMHLYAVMVGYHGKNMCNPIWIRDCTGHFHFTWKNNGTFIYAGWLQVKSPFCRCSSFAMILPSDVHLHGLQRCQALCTIGCQPSAMRVPMGMGGKHQAPEMISGASTFP